MSSPVFLRALEDSDLEFLYALENDASIWGVSDTLAPVSRHALRQYLAHATADFYEVRQLRLVICAVSDGQPVGTVELFSFDPLHQRAGVGITTVAAQRRQGYATAALLLLTDYAARTLRLHQIHCTIAADNQVSLVLFEGVGFQRVGLRREWLRTGDGMWQDAVELQLLLKPLSITSSSKLA